jgi:dCMP deaminase
MNNKRISWEEYAIKIAEVASYRSEDQYVQVGATALDHSNRVIGVAYNGLGSGVNVDETFWNDRDKRRPFMIHAEINLLSLIKRGECKLLACTLLPCSSCAAAIVAHGIKNVVYKDEYFRDNLALEIFKFNGIECKQVKF